jgi:hypothetical protein
MNPVAECDFFKSLSHFLRRGVVKNLAITIYIYVHSRKQKLAALYIQIAHQAVQSSSKFYDSFVALYLLFLPSHRYRTKQNRSCQLLLNVRMQYGCFTQCQKRIKSLISFKVSVLLAELYVKYKLISDVVK